LGLGGGRNPERRRGGGRRGGGAKNTAAERTALVFVVRGEKIELKKTETKSESNLNLETREAKKQSDLSGRFSIRAMEGRGCFEIGDGSFRFFFSFICKHPIDVQGALVVVDVYIVAWKVLEHCQI
jgi:hypothetical protein